MVTLTCDIASSRLSFARLLFAPAEPAADGIDRVVDPLRHLAIDGLEPTGAGGGLIEFAGQPRAIGVERMDLADQGLPAAVSLAPPFDGRVQCLERARQAPARNFNRIGFAHAPIR